MNLLNIVDLHLLERVRGAIQLDVYQTYKLAMNPGHSSREL